MSDERYALDGWDTAKPGAVGTENFDVFADLDAAGTVTARRVFGPGFDAPVARLDPSGEVGWYGADSQGSVRLIFDNTGTVTGSRDYTAFGAITAESGAGLDRYAYTAREWDATLGLQDNRQRMYDPLTGRFTSEDPSGLAAGDVNLFRYAGNAVTVFTDPSGLQPPDRGSWWNRFGNQVRNRASEGFDRFSNGLEQLSHPARVAERFGNGVEEFGRRAETFGEKFLSTGGSFGTAEGRQRAADIYSNGAAWWADQIANNSAEYTADAILAYLFFRSPAVAADAAEVAAAYGMKRCPVPKPSGKAVGRSEVTNSVSNLGQGYRAVDEFAPDTAFSGVYDPETKQLLAYPSSRNPRGEPIEAVLKDGTVVTDNVVSRGGGHAEVNDVLSRLTGHVAPNENNFGFTLFLKEDGNLRVEWFSRSVNGNNPAADGNFVPKHRQSEIRRELKKLFPGKEIEG